VTIQSNNATLQDSGRTQDLGDLCSVQTNIFGALIIKGVMRCPECQPGQGLPLSMARAEQGELCFKRSTELRGDGLPKPQPFYSVPAMLFTPLSRNSNGIAVVEIFTRSKCSTSYSVENLTLWRQWLY
jgi:hypothetical protein